MFTLLNAAIELAATATNAALEQVTTPVNDALEGYSPAAIIALTLASAWTLKQLASLPSDYRARHAVDYRSEGISRAFGLLQWVPGLNRVVNRFARDEKDKVLNDLEEDVASYRARQEMLARLHKDGADDETILAAFEGMQEDHSDHGFSGTEYYRPDEKFLELLAKVFKRTAYINPLHDDWPKIKKMRAEVISWAQNLFSGETGGPGLITHGGTTSIIEAMNMYVQAARAKGIEQPEIVVPATAHAAFLKAAALTNAKLIVVPVDSDTGAVKPEVMKRYLSKNTAVMVGSAPSFPFGNPDPIEELGKIASDYGVGFHVDSCLGGFVTAFTKDRKVKTEDGEQTMPPMDFRVKGVTSISGDTHKYGFCPKGSSILLVKKGSGFCPAYINLKWSGGVYVTENYLDGSQSGLPIGLIYATMRHIGEDEYQKFANRILDVADAIRERAKTIEGLKVSDNHLMVVSFQGAGVNIDVVCQHLKELGYSLSRVQDPDGFHLCVTNIHCETQGFVDDFIAKLSEAVAYAKEHPNEKIKGSLKAYGKLNTGPGVPYQVQREIGEGYVRILQSTGFAAKDIPENDRSIAEALDLKPGETAVFDTLAPALQATPAI